MSFPQAIGGRVVLCSKWFSRTKKKDKGTSFHPVFQEHRVQLNLIITQLGMIIKIAIYHCNIFKVTWNIFKVIWSAQ